MLGAVSKTSNLQDTHGLFALITLSKADVKCLQFVNGEVVIENWSSVAAA